MRALLISLNGLGVGGAPDAAKFNDEGANTLGHLFADHPGIELPTLFSLGLASLVEGKTPPDHPAASFGRMNPASPGKDILSGHWEMAGVRLEKPFAALNEFPTELVQAVETAAGVEFLGNATSVPSPLAEFGPAHMKTGKPILYASPEGAFCIAAHESLIPHERLLAITRIARKHADPLRIPCVSAVPLNGKIGKPSPGTHVDFPMVPPRTILNAISETGLHVDAIGKTSALFARSGITRHHPATGLGESLAIIESIWHTHQEGLIFASLPGLADHSIRRDTPEFARAHMQFDTWLAGFLSNVEYEDLLIITSAVACDPTSSGQGPTREAVPLLVKFDKKFESLGTRETFADVAATLAQYFTLKQPWPFGTPFYKFPKPRR